MTKSDITQPDNMTETDTVFDILRNKRLASGIAISQAASYLKISIKNIEAIEEGNVALIPKELYLMGIIRSYSKMLQIDQTLIAEKVSLLSIESNMQNKNYKLLNIGENLDLKPNREQFYNFIIISSLLFLIFLSFFNIHEDKRHLINTENLAEELGNVN